MTPGDTARLLALVQAFDNRKVDELVVAAWQPLLAITDFDDACDAVREHYARTSEWVMPADVLAGVKRIRADRLDRVPLAVPAADPDDVPAYLADLRAQRHRDAGQRVLDHRALVGVFRDVPSVSPSAIEAARAALPVRQPTVREENPGMAQARAELAAREPVPVPDEKPAP